MPELEFDAAFIGVEHPYDDEIPPIAQPCNSRPETSLRSTFHPIRQFARISRPKLRQAVLPSQ